MSWVCCAPDSKCVEPTIEENGVHSGHSAGSEIKRSNKVADEGLMKEKFMESSVIKILLLGGPESGKSTIFKQMRILHMNGFTETDIRNYRQLIQCNLIQAVYQLIEAARYLNLVIEDNERIIIDMFAEYYLKFIHQNYNSFEELGCIIQKIYNARVIREVLFRQHEISLMDSAIYFLDHISRIFHSDYRPTEQDILRSRIQTSGIIEVEFRYKRSMLRMVDVGGQRTEQRKWIHCFDNVHGILFVADIAGYNQNFHDGHETSNRLKYSIKLFNRLLNTKCFTMKTAIILFFNKVDIFKERIKLFPLTLCFASYKGKNTYEETSVYVELRFLYSNEHKGFDDREEKHIFTHFTNATNSDNISKVFGDCVTVIIENNLHKSGWN